MLKKILVALAIAAAAIAVAWGVTLHRVRALALHLLGPGSSVEEVNLHWGWVELRGVRVPPSEGWPAPDSLTADTVDIYPDVSTIFGDTIHIRDAKGRGVYMSVLRTSDRQIRFLPTILPRPPHDPSKPPPRDVTIARATVEGSTLDLFDASVASPPHHVKVVGVEGEAADMLFPSLATKVTFHVKGHSQEPDGGTGAVDGWTVFAQRECEVRVKLDDVDIARMQPYFLRHQESGSASGRLDLEMDARIHDHYLDAPGRMQLTDFELDAGEGPVATFMGLPRKAVIAAMADKHGRIDLTFEMKGNLGDAKFSLNESFATRVAAGLGTALGVTVGGIVKGIGEVGEQGLKAVGNAFGAIFGGGKKKDNRPAPSNPQADE